MASTAGQIIKRGERKWLLRVDLGRDEQGKRQRLNRTVHGSKKEAQQVLNEMLHAKDTGTLIQRSKESLNAYLDRWLKTAVKPRVRERTHKEYSSTLRRYVRPALGARRLSSINPVDIQNLYSTMQARGLKDSARYTHTVFRDALNQAVKWQMLSRNPADYVELPKQNRQEMQSLTEEEAARFLKTAKINKWYCFFSVLLGTGLRPSEALGLYWSDLDLAKGTLTVRRALGFVNGRWVFEEPKTKNSRRTIPLPPPLVADLSDHMTRQHERGIDADLVFTNLSGDPVHENNIAQNHFKKLAKRIGLAPAVRLYDLRHTHATLLLQAGVNAKVVAERLGHSSIKITLDTYAHVLPNMQQEAADKLTGILYPAPSEERNALQAPN